MVVSVVGIMGVVAIPNFIDFRTDAKQSLTQEKLVNIKKAIIGDARIIVDGRIVAAGFIAHVGVTPTTLDDLVTQGAWPTYNPFTKQGWRGPYLDSSSSDWNLDSWGTAIIYDQAGRTITSCGNDLTCGNADDIQVSF